MKYKESRKYSNSGETSSGFKKIILSLLESIAEGLLGREFVRMNLGKKSKSEERIILPYSSLNFVKPVVDQLPCCWINEADAWKLFYFAAGRPTEISVLGRAENFQGSMLIANLRFPVQRCSVARTEIDKEYEANYWRKLALEERSRIYASSLMVWVHSHLPPYGAFWSGYDAAQINQMMEGRDFFISLLISADCRKLNYRLRYDFSKPVRLTIDNVPLLLLKDTDIDHAKIKSEMDAEYAEKVAILSNYYLPSFDDEDWE